MKTWYFFTNWELNYSLDIYTFNFYNMNSLRNWDKSYAATSCVWKKCNIFEFFYHRLTNILSYYLLIFFSTLCICIKVNKCCNKLLKKCLLLQIKFKDVPTCNINLHCLHSIIKMITIKKLEISSVVCVYVCGAYNLSLHKKHTFIYIMS